MRNKKKISAILLLLLSIKKKKKIEQEKLFLVAREARKNRQKALSNNTNRSFKEYCDMIINDEENVSKHLAVSKEVLEKMSKSVDELGLHHNTKLTSHEQCVIFLLFVGGGTSFGYLARAHGLSKTTISTVVTRLSRTINSTLSSIKFPETAEQWRNVEMTYRRRNMMPTLGSLDGKHVRIRAPPQSGSLFYNYKGFFSFVLLALVDGDGKFLWVDLGSPGSTNDATIYNNSRLKTVLEDGATLPKCTFWDSDIVMPSFIIADGIFPLSKSLMKPFGRRSLTPEESIYNKKLSNARVRVEHTFGMLAKRFRILDRSIECSYECAIEIVTAMCHLHNLLVPPPQSNSIDSVEECDVYPYKDAKEQREYLKFLLNK